MSVFFTGEYKVELRNKIVVITGGGSGIGSGSGSVKGNVDNSEQGAVVTDDKESQPWLLILEDDVELVDGFKDQLTLAIRELEEEGGVKSGREKGRGDCRKSDFRIFEEKNSYPKWVLEVSFQMRTLEINFLTHFFDPNGSKMA